MAVKDSDVTKVYTPHAQVTPEDLRVFNIVEREAGKVIMEELILQSMRVDSQLHRLYTEM